ncbi:hypothetical protein A3F06_03935 [candidate division TM6 bacterium RIFCSPHIGHO2_12_FULL_36_22]|nr:MAG: hypothetical protein A3F06_03935 [candidate division TM6 bacterium RIFCSPHIGHO2_12_FULL_36_22]
MSEFKSEYEPSCGVTPSAVEAVIRHGQIIDMSQRHHGGQKIVKSFNGLRVVYENNIIITVYQEKMAYRNKIGITNKIVNKNADNLDVLMVMQKLVNSYIKKTISFEELQRGVESLFCMYNKVLFDDIAKLIDEFAWRLELSWVLCIHEQEDYEDQSIYLQPHIENFIKDIQQCRENIAGR